MGELQRQLAAVMYADMVGFAALMAVWPILMTGRVRYGSYAQSTLLSSGSDARGSWKTLGVSSQN